MSFGGYFASITSAAKSKYTNLRLTSFDSNSDIDHPDNEDESAVSRALREYYKEKDGFVPDWLAPITAPLAPTQSRTQTQGKPVPTASLSDIFDSPGPAATAAPPQQHAPPGRFGPGQPPYDPRLGGPPGPGRRLSPAQANPSAPPVQPVGLPGKVKGGVRPFMAMKKQQQQQVPEPPQQQQNYQQPYQQSYSPPPPPPNPNQPYNSGSGSSGYGRDAATAAAPRQGLKDRMLNRTQPGGNKVPSPNGSQSSIATRDQQFYTPSQSPSNNRHGYPQSAPSAAYGPGTGSGGGGRSRFAAAAGEPEKRRNPAPDNKGQKPFLSATAPWTGGADDDFGGWGGSPGFYGK